MSKCKTGEDGQEWFKCNDAHGLCIVEPWRCDGEPDCLDGSDELDCVNYNRTRLGNKRNFSFPMRYTQYVWFFKDISNFFSQVVLKSCQIFSSNGPYLLLICFFVNVMENQVKMHF